ncbi:MAG TPA: hypothetical protein VEY12_02040 [Thermoplasmata archaeon]|nr:hypothetical protein [Thermoplasmata archaeon]
MADLGTTINDFLTSIARNPVYLLLTVGLVAVLLLAIVAHHIHKIRSQEIFVHQAWGANWKGR